MEISTFVIKFSGYLYSFSLGIHRLYVPQNNFLEQMTLYILDKGAKNYKNNAENNNH